MELTTRTKDKLNIFCYLPLFFGGSKRLPHSFVSLHYRKSLRIQCYPHKINLTVNELSLTAKCIGTEKNHKPGQLRF